MFKLASSLLLALSLVTAAACGEVVPIDDNQAGDGGTGGDGGSEGDGGTPLDPCEGDIAFEDLTQCLVAAQCKLFTRCQPLFADEQECIDKLPLFASDFTEGIDRFAFGITEGLITYDGEKAAECLASFSGTSCNSDGPESEVCEEVFTGTIADNDECLSSETCATLGAECRQEMCDPNAECCVGFCLPPVPTGQSCFEGQRCEPGDHCVFEDGAGGNGQGATCQTGADGSPCEGDFSCDSGLFCSDGAKTCVGVFDAGANCQRDGQCGGFNFCIQGVCQSPDAAGADCEESCLDGLICVQGQCQERPGLDESCAAVPICNSIDLFCEPNQRICAPRLGDDQPCNGSNECELGLFCTSELPGSGGGEGVCAQPLANGFGCDSGRQCESGFCDFNSSGNGTCQDEVICL